MNPYDEINEREYTDTFVTKWYKINIKVMVIDD